MMSRFLSHDQTKADLTEYLAQKNWNKDSSQLIITFAAGHTRSNKVVGHFPHNNHEEADTLMISLGGVAATVHSSRNVEMMFFSPDTDVLVLLIANYDVLPKNTSISRLQGRFTSSQYGQLWDQRRQKLCQHCTHSLEPTTLVALHE
ncbi:hypothetical protein GWK47_046280 [Chionoecetes opilio]|uniref:Uncharacterized protein n=1 Tax=Chionoecetes opilio TaxID=41210 RepID=A0A8J5CX91_CHIOP|nr:hypothetical protein GWK47_046280 [Chionoecetes opilio]